MTDTTSISPVFIEALGSCVRLDIEDAALRDAIASLWRDLRRPDEPGPPIAVRRVVVSGTGPWHITGADPPAWRQELPDPPDPARDARDTTAAPETVSEVCAAINLPLAAHGPMLAAHCAVLTRGAVTLVIPGVSGAGKTTLTVALLQRGWRYVSDEALALDWETGALGSYPRPLGISDWTTSALGVVGGVAGTGERFVRAAELGASIERQPGPATHIVLPRRDGAAAPQLASAHRMEALEELMHRGFNFYQAPAKALPLMADLVRGAEALALSYSDARAAADFLTSSLTAKSVSFQSDDARSSRP